MRCDDEAVFRGLRQVKPVRRRMSPGQPPLWTRLAGLLVSLVLHGAFFFALAGSPATKAAHDLVVTVRLLPATPIPPRTSDPGPSTRSSRLPDAEEFQKHESDVASVMTRSHSPTAGSPRTGSGSSAATSERNTLRPEKIRAVAPSPRPAQDQVNLAPQPPSFYLGQLAECLSRVKQYPIAALGRREEGVVLLSMRLDRLGRLLSWHIAASSGYRDLDNEVSAMVAEAAPFPPFPALWNPPSADFLVPVVFGLN
jgi:periplasmic protein TonB